MTEENLYPISELVGAALYDLWRKVYFEFVGQSRMEGSLRMFLTKDDHISLGLASLCFDM